MFPYIDSRYVVFVDDQSACFALPDFDRRSEHIILEGDYAFTTWPYADGGSFHGWEGVAA